MKQLLVLSILMLMGCKSEPEVTDKSVDQQNQAYTISTEDIEAMDYTDYVLSPKSKEAILDWQKFQDLQVNIELLKNANLSFFKVEKKIMEQFLTELKSEQPLALNTPAIRSRITVLETDMLRLQNVSNLDNIKKTELLEVVKELLVADANLKLQINKKLEKESQQIELPVRTE